jgi:hypothetical protein
MGFLAVLVVGGMFQPLGLDPATATGRALEQPQHEPPDHAQVRLRMIPPHAAFVLT